MIQTTRMTAQSPMLPASQRALFAELVTQHRALVCGVAYSALGDTAKSEDVAQDAFLIAWRKLASLDEPEKLPAFLCGIARHLALNARRKSARESLSDSVSEGESAAGTPYDLLAAKENQELVWRSLEELSDNDREALVLFYRVGKSISELALALDVSESVAKQRLSRGRKRLTSKVTAIVEQTLEASKPGAAFTAALLLAFDSAGVAHAAAATSGSVSASAGAPAGSGMLGSKTLIALLSVALIGVLASVVLFAGGSADKSATSSTSQMPSADEHSEQGGVEERSETELDHDSIPNSRHVAVIGGSAEIKATADDASTIPGVEPPPSTLNGELDTRRSLQAKIDLDFGQVKIRDLLRLFSDVTEVDFVIRGDISAMVNIRMRRTPAIDALDEALLQAGAQRNEIPVLRVVQGSVGSAHLVSGQPLSAEFANAPIEEVVEFFSAHADVPIVVSKDLDSAGVTMRFANEEFGIAFARFLRESELGFETGFAFEISPNVAAPGVETDL